MSVYGNDFLEIPSNPCISTSTKFTNSVKFVIDQPSNCYISGKNSYVSLGLNISYCREDNKLYPLEPLINTGTRLIPESISIPYLSSNPVGSLFQSVTCSVNNKENITNYSMFPQTTTLYRYMIESENEQKTVSSTNSINPLNTEDIDVSVGSVCDNFLTIGRDLGCNPANGLQNLFTKHMIYALKQQYNFNKKNTNILTMQVPISLFQQDSLIYVGSNGKIEITFNIDPFWYTNLINIAGSSYNNMSGLPTGVNGVTAAPYNILPTPNNNNYTPFNIYVSVTDMRLYISLSC